MMTKASIILLASIFLRFADECQSFGYSHVRKLPRLQFDIVSAKPFYTCTFNFEASCDWFIDDLLINPFYYNYTWKTGNGVNTYDCSIEGKTLYTKAISIDNHKNIIICEGFGNGSIKVGLGGSIELYCSRNVNEMCEWKRADERVIISTNGRYVYTNDHECSIRIDGIQQTDLAQWKCSNVDSNNWSAVTIATYTIALQNSAGQTSFQDATTWRPAKGLESSVMSTATSANAEVSNIYFNPKTYVVINEEGSKVTNSTIASKLVASVLGSVGIVSLAAIVIGVLWFIRKRSKKSKTTSRDKQADDNTEEDVCRDLIRLESLAASSTVAHSFDDSFRPLTAEYQSEYTDSYITPIPHSINMNEAPPPYANVNTRNNDTTNVDNDIYDYATPNK